jgi:phenylalanyl-tRNA synthetase beta chain
LENAKHRESFRLFEIGLEIHKTPQSLPIEIPHLVAAIYAREGDGAAGLFEIKRVAECLLRGAIAEPVPASSFEHPARAAALVWKGETVGRFFELHPSLVKSGRAAILDLDLQRIEPLFAREIKYTPIRRFPSSAFDLSVIVAARELTGKLRALIEHPLLESVEYVRQYSGPPLAEGQKSVTFRVTVGSPERTLSSDEITAIRAAIIARMRDLGYDFRE